MLRHQSGQVLETEESEALVFGESLLPGCVETPGGQVGPDAERLDRNEMGNLVVDEADTVQGYRVGLVESDEVISLGLGKVFVKDVLLFETVAEAVSLEENIYGSAVLGGGDGEVEAFVKSTNGLGDTGERRQQSRPSLGILLHASATIVELFLIGCQLFFRYGFFEGVETGLILDFIEYIGFEYAEKDAVILGEIAQRHELRKLVKERSVLILKGVYGFFVQGFRHRQLVVWSHGDVCVDRRQQRIVDRVAEDAIEIEDKDFVGG
jgi:hypothetical protein